VPAGGAVTRAAREPVRNQRRGDTGGAPADVTITGTSQALTALIFAGSDAGLGISGERGPVRRFRELIGTLATVVNPA
jgi:hypothetical protein